MVKEVEDLRLMPEFVKEGVVTEQELDEQYARAMHRIEELELRNMLRRDEDRMGAIMDINSGACVLVRLCVSTLSLAASD